MAFLSLAACSEQSDPPRGDLVDCAIGPGAELQKVCVLEIVEGTDQFVIHNPDGGFRRFTSDPEGGWQVLDGADEMTGRFGFDNDFVEFNVADETYQMPLSMLPKRLND